MKPYCQKAVFPALALYTGQESPDLTFPDVYKRGGICNPYVHPPFSVDHTKQAAWAASQIADKATAIAWCQTLLTCIITHMLEFVGSCSPTGKLRGNAWWEWLEAFFSPESGLHDILAHLLWSENALNEDALETCLAVMKSCLGWFPDTEPTVAAAAMYLLNSDALAWLPLDLPIDKSEGVCRVQLVDFEGNRPGSVNEYVVVPMMYHPKTRQGFRACFHPENWQLIADADKRRQNNRVPSWYVLSLPAKLRYGIAARLMAAHGNTVEEICHAIHPEAFRNTGLMLNIDGNQLCTYALGPDWQKYLELIRSYPAGSTRDYYMPEVLT